MTGHLPWYWKNSLKHAAKIHGGQSELPEQTEDDCTHDALMHLYINQSTKQVILFSKNQPVMRNWMRGQIYVLVNSIPALIICYKKFAGKISMDLDINTFS